MSNLILAVLLGSLIGIERQWRQRIAGLRTNALVSAGAALFVLLSQRLPTGGDDTRIAAYIVSGVGFLGAGVIMKDGAAIRGLNTAATLWCSAAIGSLAGFGFYFDSIFGALVVLGTHFFLRPVAQRINQKSNESNEQEFRYRIRIVCREEEETQVRFLILQAVSTSSLVLQSLNSEDLNGSKKVAVTADVDSTRRSNSILEQVVNRLSLERGVSAASWALSPKEEAA